MRERSAPVQQPSGRIAMFRAWGDEMRRIGSLREWLDTSPPGEAPDLAGLAERLAPLRDSLMGPRGSGTPDWSTALITSAEWAVWTDSLLTVTVEHDGKTAKWHINLDPGLFSPTVGPRRPPRKKMTPQLAGSLLADVLAGNGRAGLEDSHVPHVAALLRERLTPAQCARLAEELSRAAPLG